jgi:hypothetical protein
VSPLSAEFDTFSGCFERILLVLVLKFALKTPCAETRENSASHKIEPPSLFPASRQSDKSAQAKKETSSKPTQQTTQNSAANNSIPEVHNMATATQKKSKKLQIKSATTMNDKSYEYVAGPGASGNGSAKRIRAPHANDVLSGRGGSVNQHAGNIQFRDWVSKRKYDYNLARDKNQKAAICREVIAQVYEQTPPGRFLGRESSSSSWWVELDDERIMAKTSQALREGAPKIRAEHRGEWPGAAASRRGGSRKTKRAAAEIGPTEEKPAAQRKKAAKGAAPRMVTSGGVETRDEEYDDTSFPRQEKRVRVDYRGHAVRPDEETPPLVPIAAPHLDDHLLLSPNTKLEDHILMPAPASYHQFPCPPPASLRRLHENWQNAINNSRSSQSEEGPRLVRSHSLALSDVSSGHDWASEEFVNPFDDDMERELLSRKVSLNSSPRPGLMRESSASSHGDMGGIGALMRTNSAKQYSAKPSSVSSTSPRSRNGVRANNLSQRSLSSVLSDLPDASMRQPTDFAEGMHMIYEALHRDEDDETTAHVMPHSRGGMYRNSNGRGISVGENRQ